MFTQRVSTHVINNIERLDLSYCELRNKTKVSEIVEILHICTKLVEVKFLQYNNDSELRGKTQDYLSVVSEGMK